jgi:hypothetical protein
MRFAVAGTSNVMILLTLIVSAMFSLGWHTLLKGNYWIAVLASGATSTGAIWIVTASHMTDRDALILLAITLIVAAVIGKLLRRTKSTNDKNDKGPG